MGVNWIQLVQPHLDAAQDDDVRVYHYVAVQVKESK
jgi:hypothetical protein